MHQAPLLLLIACLWALGTGVPVGEDVNSMTSKISKSKVRDDSCHARALDKCLYKFFYFTHRPNTTGIVTNVKDFNLLCRVYPIVLRCVGRHLKRCGTDMFQGAYSFIKVQIMHAFKEFCAIDGMPRKNFLKYAPCLHKKVKLDPIYKAVCVKDLQAGLELMSKRDSMDDKVDTGCCAYNRWEDCITGMTMDKCGESKGDPMAKKCITDLINSGSGRLIEKACKRDVFDPNSEFCMKAMPKTGTKALGRHSNSAFSKYFTLICPNTGF